MTPIKGIFTIVSMGTGRLDPIKVRRAYLLSGCDPQATAEEMKCSRQAVYAALKRANRDEPLTYQAGDPEDQRAMTAAVRLYLQRIGIALPVKRPE